MMHEEVFSQERAHLLALAYRMLGSMADAEDIVQETWLRWQQVELRDIEVPRAWLTRTATNLCIDQLRSARSRRETYVGPWLPEPVRSDREMNTLASNPSLVESLSLAFLSLLDALDPLERAVFLLHQVFEFEHTEIAELLGISSANSRKILERARAQLLTKSPKKRVSKETHQRLLGAFLTACGAGDAEGLGKLLAHDVTLWSDGGGKRKAALKPLHGLEKVVKFVLATTAMQKDVSVELAELNGQPGVLVRSSGVLDSAVLLELEEEHICGIYIVRNPDKLQRL